MDKDSTYKMYVIEKEENTMIAEKVRELEHENVQLRNTLMELARKMEQGEVLKPKSCQYCRNFVQHYRKETNGRYEPVYAGHCTSRVPIKKGGKKNPVPDDICPYFELGQRERNTYKGI